MAKVQSTSTSGYGVSSLSPSLSGTAAGNLAVLVVIWAQPQTGAPAAPSGWSTAIAPNGFTTAAFGSPYCTGAAIYYKENIAGGTLTPTVNFVNSSCAGWAILTEYSGYATASSLDQTASNGSTSASSGNSGTTGTTATANELVVAAVGCCGFNANGANGISDPASSGYSSVFVNQDGNALIPCEVSYKEISATGTQTASWSWSSSGEYAASIATFKAATAAASIPNVVKMINQAVNRSRTY